MIVFLEVNVRYLEKLLELDHDLLFLSEWIKIEKVKNLAANLHDKAEYVIHVWNSKQALNHGLVLEKVHKVIKFNQNAWLKLPIDMNTDLGKKKQKMILKNIFFKFINNRVFWKTIQNVRKYRDCHNRKKKKLFGTWAKLSHYKVFHKKYISNRNEKKRHL